MLKKTVALLVIALAGFINTSYSGGDINAVNNNPEVSIDSLQIDSPSEKMKVAVVEFEIQGDLGVQDAGKIMAEWMITSVGKTGKFIMVERVLLKKILEEDKLIMAGVVDEGSAMEIGQKYGVDAIITGAVSKWGTTYTVTTRLIDTKTGEALKFAETKTKDIDAIPDKINALASELASAAPAQEERITLNKAKKKNKKQKKFSNSDRQMFAPVRMQLMGGLNFSAGAQYFFTPGFSLSALLGGTYYFNYPGLDDGVFPTAEIFASYNFLDTGHFTMGAGVGADLFFTSWVIISPAIRLELGLGKVFLNGGLRYGDSDTPVYPFVEFGVKF